MKLPINNATLAHEYRYGRGHSTILYRLLRYGQARRVNGAPLGNQNAKGKAG